MRTYTKTITDAGYFAAKIAADLKRLQRLSGRGVPSDKAIGDYQQEAQQLIYGGYLKTVIYGFRNANQQWLLYVQYTLGRISLICEDNDFLNARANQDFSETRFASFLEFSDKWNQLGKEERQKIEDGLPLTREPKNASYGDWVEQENNSN